LAHETAHVTQRHIVRGLIDQSHAGLLTTAAMLAGILLGATAGRGNPNAIEGAILAGQGAAIPASDQLHPRQTEYEADRIGIGTMVSAGYDPLGMASFFDYMSPKRTESGARQCHTIPHRPSDLFGPRRRSEESRRSSWPGASRGFIGLSVDRERLAFRGSRSGGALHTRQAGQERRRARHRGALRPRRSRESTRERLPPAIPELHALVASIRASCSSIGALGQAYLATKSTERNPGPS